MANESPDTDLMLTKKNNKNNIVTMHMCTLLQGCEQSTTGGGDQYKIRWMLKTTLYMNEVL